MGVTASGAGDRTSLAGQPDTAQADSISTVLIVPTNSLAVKELVGTIRHMSERERLETPASSAEHFWSLIHGDAARWRTSRTAQWCANQRAAVERRARLPHWECCARHPAR